MKDLVIRESNIEDINDIIDLYGKTIWKTEKQIDSNLKSGFENGEELKKLILNDINDENTIILIAELDKKIVGYISASIGTLEEAYIENVANIHEIAIKEEYQKQGIGTSLLDECTRILKSRNVGYIKLTMFKQNTKAKTFYEDNGFEEYSVNYRKKI